MTTSIINTYDIPTTYEQVTNWLNQDAGRSHQVRAIFYDLWPILSASDITALAALHAPFGLTPEEIVACWLCGYLATTNPSRLPGAVLNAWHAIGN